MTRDGRLALLLILLMGYGLFVVEGRYRHDESTTDVRHRHRHRHEGTVNRRNHYDPTDKRSSWSQDLDYEDALAGEPEDRDAEDEEEEDDYDTGTYYERSYPRSARNGYHGRTFEPRYPPRYPHRGGYHGNGWYDGDNERRKGPPRYPGRNYRLGSTDRHYRKIGHSRSRDTSDYDYEPEADDTDYERSRRYDEEERNERHHGGWKNSRRNRIHSRRDWRAKLNENHRGSKRYEDDDVEMKRHDDRKWWPNITESKYSLSKNDKRRTEDADDYEYQVDGVIDKGKDEEEDDPWKDLDDEDEEDEEEFDNDFYKNDRKSPLKTYDDIIRRLTSDDPTTQRTTVKREYRNIETEKYAKRDAFGNFRYEPKNFTRHSKSASSFAPNYQSSRKAVENSAIESVSSSNDRRFGKDAIATRSSDRQEKKAALKSEDVKTKTKSLEQDYEEYLNAPDEKEEDLIKAGVEEDSGMQADVTNTDYADDADEGETPATLSTSTTSTTTTTTTTTTTPRPVVTQHYDYRDTRSYDSSTGSQYNGYQSKNDYPPMSAHSLHKWQSLGTRESVKETRGNVQQYNKNGKTAEIREALQHAIKVSREGSCQWPRPRVIPVRDVYPSPSTTYIPHCAILHRCSDDTGCCRSEALTCVPKHTHRVELSFYTTVVGGSSVVEKLSFYNHTECECRERTEFDTMNEKQSEQRIYRHHQPLQPQNIRRPPPRKPCRCPSEFTPRITPEGECQCNCFETHHNCIKTRRGKGYFSLADRLCIQNEECATPRCEFGEYMRRQGKCPKKRDKFDSIANYRTNLNHRYRS